MSEIERYYQVLDLKPGASKGEIKKAYRILVKVWHPDRFSHDPNLQKKAQERLKEINVAYKKLRFYLDGKLEEFPARDGPSYSESESPPSEPAHKSERKQEKTTDHKTHSKPQPEQSSSQQPGDAEATVYKMPQVSPINLKRGLALALVVIGALILLDQMGTGYGLREGWPWLIITLGIGGFFRNRRGFAAWTITIIGVFILLTRYYSIHITIPVVVKTYFLPVILIFIGLLWLLRSLNKSR